MPDVDGPWRCVPCQMKGYRECVCVASTPVDPLAPHAIRSEREKVYGPPIDSMTNIGQVWGGVLIHAGWKAPKGGRNVLPHVVSGMLAGLKVVRNVTEDGAYTDDTCPDTKNYADFGDEFHPRRPK